MALAYLLTTGTTPTLHTLDDQMAAPTTPGLTTSYTPETSTT